MFHIVAERSCWVAVDDGARYWADQGDVIVMPYGDHYVMGGEPPAECVSILSLLDPLPWAVMPAAPPRRGRARTDIVCGYMHSEDPLFDPAMRALPPVFVVRLPPGPAAGWVQASIAYSLEESCAPVEPEPSLIATRLPELVLIEVFARTLRRRPRPIEGWLAALRDPVLGARTVAVAQLARSATGRSPSSHRGAAVSRSLLDERFRQVLGRSPIRYLTEWRMHLADELLATTDLAIFDIARRVGYDSEEAFSRAFKRERELSPSHWRSARSLPSDATTDS